MKDLQELLERVRNAPTIPLADAKVGTITDPESETPPQPLVEHKTKGKGGRWKAHEHGPDGAAVDSSGNRLPPEYQQGYSGGKPVNVGGAAPAAPDNSSLAAMERGAAKFEAAGGTITEISDDPEGFMDANFEADEIESVMLSTGTNPDMRGISMTKIALKEGMEYKNEYGEEVAAATHTYVARDAQGRLAGAMTIFDGEGPWDMSMAANEQVAWLSLSSVGTTGRVDGTGSAFTKLALGRAKSLRQGAMLQPLDQTAARFWSAMGFTPTPSAHGMEMDYDTVRNLV